MKDDRQVKCVTLGWMERLEEVDKVPGKKRKTQLYWRKILKEAGIDVSNIAQLTKDRVGWKAIVKERMEHLEGWERRRGKRVPEEPGDRNHTPEVTETFVCDWDNCGRSCKSKAGLINHRRRMHEISEDKVKHKCSRCQQEFVQEANLLNHSKICTGLTAVDPNKRKCDVCGREIGKKGFARHYRTCNPNQEDRPRIAARQYRGERGECDVCGIGMTKSNIARHKRLHCRGEAAIS